MKIPRFVVAGTGSGVGKTTITLGLMEAFKQRGLTVQGYKAGPDFIDPSFHTVVTGRASRNLDSWMLSPSTLEEIMYRGSYGADLSIIEGMMGLFDGKNPKELQGSTAEVSQRVKAPIILVVSAESMARSAAAVVLGFQLMEPNVTIAGVIVNAVGSEGHYQLLKTAIEDRCRIPVIGYLTREEEISLSERHLGLIPAWEHAGYKEKIEHAARIIQESVDLDKLLEIAQSAPDIKAETRLFPHHALAAKVCIAVARDAAFNFYYPENLELLEHFGARLIEFAPLAGERIPEEANGLYLGGGFPEEFAEVLSNHQDMLADLKVKIENGLPTFAECGGYMLLAESLTDREGKTHHMAGVIPAHVHMQSRLAALGYREVSGYQDSLILEAGETARGHEFHYSTIQYHDDVRPAYQMTKFDQLVYEGVSAENLIAGYTHLHFGSNPNLAKRFVDSCRAYGLV